MVCRARLTLVSTGDGLAFVASAPRGMVSSGSGLSTGNTVWLGGCQASVSSGSGPVGGGGGFSISTAPALGESTSSSILTTDSLFSLRFFHQRQYTRNSRAAVNSARTKYTIVSTVLESVTSLSTISCSEEMPIRACSPPPKTWPSILPSFVMTISLFGFLGWLAENRGVGGGAQVGKEVGTEKTAIVGAMEGLMVVGAVDVGAVDGEREGADDGAVGASVVGAAEGEKVSAT